MDDSVLPVDFAEIREFFFEGMSRGWVADGPENDVFGLPGYREHIHCSDDGRLRLIDMFCVRPGSNKSAGSTTIWLEDKVVWVMQYGGWHSEEAIPFLKEVLRRAYRDKLFRSGRGPETYVGSSFYYSNENVGASAGNFFDFRGEEVIRRCPEIISVQDDLEKGEIVGRYAVWGGSFI